MTRAICALLVSGWIYVPIGSTAESRGTPTRPPVAAGKAAVPMLPVTKLEGVEYFSAADIAKKLELKGAWTEFRHGYLLSSKTTKILLESDGRHAEVNGMWLHLGNPSVVHKGQIYVSRVDFERTIVSRVRPALVTDRPPPVQVIAIDAGHGGKFDGTANAKFKTKEKDYTLDIAKRVQQLLMAANYRVVMTRTDDSELGKELEDDWKARSDIANRAGADLFVSIHLNSDADPKTSGTETFVFTPAGQRSTRSWQTKESDSEPEPYPVNKFDPWSSALAQSVQRELLASLKSVDRGQKTMHSAVMKWLNCPGVLVESLFLSSDSEGQKVMQPEHRQRIAAAIFAGIKAYGTATAAK